MLKIAKITIFREFSIKFIKSLILMKIIDFHESITHVIDVPKRVIFGVQKGVIFDPPWTPPGPPRDPPGGQKWPKKSLGDILINGLSAGGAVFVH